jgi:hypothetical protein
MTIPRSISEAFVAAANDRGFLAGEDPDEEMERRSSRLGALRRGARG